MNAVNRLMGIGLLLFSQWSLSAPAGLLDALHQMRLAANGMATHFYMFSGLNADSKYSKLIDVSKQHFISALERVKADPAAQSMQPSTEKINSQWQALNELLEVNRQDVLTKGFASIRLVDDMGRMSTTLVDDIDAAYHSVQQSTSVTPPAAVEAARNLAMLMSEITSLYAAEGTSNLGYLFVGTGENTDTIGGLADEFEQQLTTLESMNVAPDAATSLRNVASKWRFIEERVRKHNENSVPFLIVSYNEKILQHLAAIEASYQ